MKGYDMWEDFDNEDEEYEIQDDDFDFDTNFFNRLRHIRARRITTNEVINNLGDLFNEMSGIRKQEKDWYEDFCEEMQKDYVPGDKVAFEIEHLEVLDAVQLAVSEGPNGSSYYESIEEFNTYDDDGETITNFLKLLDVFGFWSMKLDLIENPQDMLDS